MYRVVISHRAEKQLATLSKNVANAISLKIDSLAENPRPVGCKKLEGGDKEYRIRTGDYRIVYRIEDAFLVIEVIQIGHRKDVYKKK